METTENATSDHTEAATSANAITPQAARFRFPLPFDPIRLLAGILTRWPLILLGGCAFAVLGFFVGKAITRQTFSLSVSLIKLRVPQTVQTSEVGQAFRPADLNDSTLLATLLATEPRDNAFKIAANGIGPNQSSSRVEASQLENTDIFYITYHSPISADDAVRFTGIWSEEIREYTKRLQQSEARGVLSILSKEVVALEKRIEEINYEILAFAKVRNYIGGESQVAAVLGKITQIDLNLEDARSREKSLRAEVADLKEKIRNHSPLNLRLRQARDELADLRATYTDENPLVQSKLESIAYLEEQIALLDNDKNMNLESFTGSPLGNQLYLDMIAANSRLTEAVNQIANLQQQQESEKERLAEFPAIMTKYDELRSKRDAFTAELSLLSNRLKEAEIFASGSPGYFQVFQEPDLRNVSPSSLLQKPILLSAAGAVAGSLLAILVGLLLTQRSTTRSALECCAAAHAPLTVILPTESNLAHSYSNFWITSLSSLISHHQGPILFWTAGLDPQTEKVFWKELAAAAKKDTSMDLHVVDFSPDQLWQEEIPPKDLAWSTDLPEKRQSLILRCNAIPDAAGRDLLRSNHYWFTIVKAEKSSLDSLSTSRPLTRACFQVCSGCIVLKAPVVGKIRLLADHLSSFLTKRFS